MFEFESQREPLRRCPFCGAPAKYVDEFELYYRQTESGAFFAAKAGFFVMAIIPISTTRVLTEKTVGYLDELSSMSSIKYENLK